MFANPFTSIKDKTPEKLTRKYEAEKKRIKKGVNFPLVLRNLKILRRYYTNEIMKLPLEMK